MTVRILKGDCRDVLRTLEPESVHCVVTSPPYWGLRDYGVVGQIGLEKSFALFVEQMLGVFREVHRVLRPDGTLWLNLGDSYATGTSSGRKPTTAGKHGYWENPSIAYRINGAGEGLKPKDLCGIPWRVAFALQADGWYLRQDIIWSKPNPMPESVTDRCTKAHEYIFMLSKSGRYYYDNDAVREPYNEASLSRYDTPMQGTDRNDGQIGNARQPGGVWNPKNQKIDPNPLGRNRRSVWTVTTQPFSEAHFATFPPALIEPCILAGCPKECCAKCGAPLVRDVERESIALRPNSNSIRGQCASSSVSGSPQRGAVASRSITLGWSPSCSCAAGIVPGTVLDPFGGAGTTGLVADRLGRNAVLIELNPEYAAMAERRIKGDAGMFASVE